MAQDPAVSALTTLLDRPVGARFLLDCPRVNLSVHMRIFIASACLSMHVGYLRLDPLSGMLAVWCRWRWTQRGLRASREASFGFAKMLTAPRQGLGVTRIDNLNVSIGVGCAGAAASSTSGIKAVPCARSCRPAARCRGPVLAD